MKLSDRIYNDSDAALWVIDEIVKLEDKIESLLETLKSTSMFLQYCWQDVPMNDYAFQKLNEQAAIVYSAIDLARGES